MKTIAQHFNVKEFPFRLYDSSGNITYFESSDGYWSKMEYDSNGNQTYYGNSNGYWYKSKYDSNGNETYYKNSHGYWCKSEYDSNGNKTYFENSNGVTRGTQKNTCNGKIVEIEGKRYKLQEIK